jgi:ABC-type nitrate/sulfonate/bicarbonate transport system permease component
MEEPQGPTLLVVDDEEALCQLIRDALARRGYRVLVATSGVDGVRLYREHAGHVQLVILSKVAFGVTLVFFVVFFNTYQGVREVDRNVLNNARMLGATDRDLLRHVLLPSALVWILSSLHTSVGLALVGAVVGEYLGSARGLGYLIHQAEALFDTTGVFAGLVVLAGFVLVVDLLVSSVERHLLRWKPPSHVEEAL